MVQLRGVTSLIFSLFVAHHLLSNVDAQCDMKDTTMGDTMPNIFNITILSYTMTVEANLKDTKRTLYATEYYDIENAQGRVDTLSGGKVTSFLYFNETDEIFTTFEQTCTTQNMNDAIKTPYDDFKVYGWNNRNPPQPIMGPSNLLRDGYQKSTEQKVAKETATQTVRGIKTNVWKRCENNNKLTIRYFFIDPKTENGFGVRGRPVPARITVQGEDEEGKSIDHTYDIVNYQIFVPDIANVFKIPKMMGCKRLAQNTKNVPSYENKDFYLEAEVVYTPWANSNYSYVSTITVAMDNPSKHFAYELTTWKSHEDAQMAEPGDDIKFIFDIRNVYKYTVDESAGTCFVDDESFSPLLKFPDGQEMDLLASDLFVRDNKTVNEYHYLGDDTERGIPVSVYEKKLQDDVEGDFDDVIITRYHLADDTFLNTEFSEKNAPVKIVYSNFNIMGKFMGIAVFNIYAFTSKVTKKREIFDVTQCFTANEQSKWVQVIFPVRENKPEDILPYVNFIGDNFLDLLNAPLMVSPLRIPKIMVDVDSDNIYVTALILERPSFMLDFNSQGNYGIKDNKVVIGITTRDKCAKACLERSSCQYFSYCGAICKLADLDPGIQGQFSDNTCELFQHDKYATSLSTMDEISAQIAGAIDLGAVIMSLPGGSKGVMEFLATGFKDGIAFGIDGINNRREDNIDERLETVILGSKFDETIADLVKPLGVQSFATCRRACVNNPSCESLSFCQATSECSLSTMHRDQIEGSHIKENWQCSIMSRVYTDYFDRYPGFILAQTARKIVDVESEDGCAKACLQETGFKCLSFDFCPYTKDPKDKCLLHTDHFINIFKNETNIKTTEECGHYSKKFIHDFDVELGKQIVKDDGSFPIADVTVEECAKYCQENIKGECLTFDFCQTGAAFETGSLCRIFSSTKGQSDRRDAPKCKIYQRSGTKTTLLLAPEKGRKAPTRQRRANRPVSK